MPDSSVIFVNSQESLSSKKALSFVDRRVLLRIPLILRQRQQEKTALKIATHLKPVTLDMVTSTTMIEYVLFVNPTL